MSTSEQNMKTYEDALYRVLNSGRLDIAKETAAEALGVELEEYLDNGLDSIRELNFLDNDNDGEIDYEALDDISEAY